MSDEKPPISLKQFKKTQSEENNLEVLAAINNLMPLLPDIMKFKHQQYLQAVEAGFSEAQAMELVKGVSL